ncbi:Thioredoxin H2 [Morella rubra]|uniref:Thioredoxin H2 n=1 Tax=Morella rubra TaxID=262757 RepID=A0A6A1WRN0_9ROSI|nr:Thioredoxin H2 [Morella rubra]
MGSILSSFLGGGETADAASSPSEPSRIQTFHSPERWQLHFNEFKDSSQLVNCDRLVSFLLDGAKMVIDFTASWCGPCRFMEPTVEAMASKFTNVGFSKIDVDVLLDVAQEFQVEAMPTFVLLKKGKEVDRVVGAKKDELEKKIEKHRAS